MFHVHKFMRSFCALPSNIFLFFPCNVNNLLDLDEGLVLRCESKLFHHVCNRASILWKLQYKYTTQRSHSPTSLDPIKCLEKNWTLMQSRFLWLIYTSRRWIGPSSSVEFQDLDRYIEDKRIPVFLITSWQWFHVGLAGSHAHTHRLSLSPLFLLGLHSRLIKRRTTTSCSCRGELMWFNHFDQSTAQPLMAFAVTLKGQNWLVMLSFSGGIW